MRLLPFRVASVAAASLLCACGLLPAGDEPLVIAHRAGADHFPENSRRAVEGSIDKGWDGVEIDLVLTSDGVPVLWHDPWIDGALCRRVGGDALGEDERVEFRTLTLAELHAQFECGGDSHPDGKHPDAERAWDRHATFDEVLDLLRASPGTLAQLDIKYEPGFTEGPERFAQEILGRWKAAGLQNPVYASATHADLLRAFKAELPGLETSLIWPRFTKKIDGRGDAPIAIGSELTVTTGLQSLGARILEAGADGVAIAWQVSNRHEVQRLRDEGFRVQLWTVGSPSRLGAFCDWPVNVLISDDPEEAPCR